MNLITLNPNDKGTNIILSNNNLTASVSSGYNSNGVRANYAIPNGKWYWEVYLTTSNYQQVGIATNAVTNMDMSTLSTRTGIRSYESYRGYKVNEASYSNSYTTADTSANQCIGVALDMTIGTLTFYKNGISLGVAFTDILSLGTIYPFVGIYSSTSGATVNFGNTLFKYPIPTGYLPYEPNNIYLRIKNNINDIKNIGDMIPCRYTSTNGQIGYFSELGTTSATLIPTTSSASPDGSFYWIYVGKDYKGRKKFIADRNIQNSISWDTLNTNGFINETILIPIIKTNTTGQTYWVLNNSYDMADYAWDGNSTSDYIRWNGTTNDFCGIKYNTSNIITKIGIKGKTSGSWGGVKNFELYGSNNATGITNGTWDLLYTGINTNDENMNYYTFNNSTSYTAYKIHLIDGYDPSTPLLKAIYEIELWENKPIATYNLSYNNIYIRLLTGGISSTDTDNEWDQIIANSTLGDNIIAGDNNIWNWSGISSWASSTNSIGNTCRTRRGNSNISTSSLNTSDTISTTVGFRPVLLVKSLIIPSIFSGNLLSSSVHTEDAILTGAITDSNNPTLKVQYKILLNDTQIYPTSGYTDFAVSPVSINYTIPNSLLINTNNKITIIINNEANLVSNYNFYVTLYNNAPNGILTLSNITTHNTNIELTGNITDTDLDQISYKILINGIEKLPYGTFFTDPYIDYTINANDLIIGDNIIEVDYKDNYKNSLMGSWENIITKTNQSSIINCQYINGSITGVITDPDSDMIQYKILINNNQVYPINDYTNFEQIANVNYQINRNDILIGKNNLITIQAKDNLNTQISQNISFIGDYVGLMFMDEQKQFYTTDIGELLQYLDFGIITLGQITEPIKILVQNKYGFFIKDINLYVQNSLPNVNIELSREENPFIATDNLVLENTYKPNDIDYFYVRLATSISSNSTSGEFKIYAKATPLSE